MTKDNQISKLPEDRDKIRNEIKRKNRVTYRHPQQRLGHPRRAKIHEQAPVNAQLVL